LAERQHTRLRIGAVALVACVLCAAVVAGYFVFGGIKSALAGDDTSTFGLGEARASTTSSVAVLARPNQQTTTENTVSEATSLSKETTRGIAYGIQLVSDRKEAERIAAEEAEKAAEKSIIAAAQAAKAEAAGSEGITSLSDVDWTVGKTAFIQTWAERIDAYLAGSPMAGQGVTFAVAAWENVVDPRWSPAISNTESSKGLVCFASYNAWGWGSSGFSSWEQAINTHVAGLSEGYGYTISTWAARKYCPPNSANWLVNTLSEMAKI